MNTLADALVYAVTYIELASGDDSRADDDCGALESIAGFLHQASATELQALREALARAIRTEQASSSPRPKVLNAYNDFIVTISDA